MDNSISLNNIRNYEPYSSSKKDTFIYKTKPYDFMSVNEIDISNQIKKISYYSNFFDILYDYDFITVLKDNPKTRLILFTYKKEHNIPFHQVIFHLNTPKLFFIFTLNTFRYLLNSIHKLQNINVCFFNISTKNIIFQTNCQIPFLTNFYNSIYISKLNIHYIKDIIDSIEDYVNKPLEVFVIFYIIKNNLTTLSCSVIDKIVDFYISQFSILEFFSQDYKNKYKQGCVLFLNKYINTPKNDILLDLFVYVNTWDIFSLSYLYLYIICSFYKVFKFFIKSVPFLDNFIRLLSDNICADPCKRNNIDTTIQNYSNLFNDKYSWDFIHNLPIENMRELFSMF